MKKERIDVKVDCGIHRINQLSPSSIVDKVIGMLLPSPSDRIKMGAALSSASEMLCFRKGYSSVARRDPRSAPN